MGSIRRRLGRCTILLGLGIALTAGLLLPAGFAQASASATDLSAEQLALREKLVVRYSLDDTATGAGAKLAATTWDTASQTFVEDTAHGATVTNQVQNRATGTVSATSGKEEGALTFTASAHARADFHLPADATGMTVSMWVKNINTYWSSLVEFWDGSDGGRFGKGTMQGNGGRTNEGDAWSANCPAHAAATIAEGGGWDSFCINVNSSDNGGGAVDPMKADTWYQVTFALTSTEMRAYRDGVLKQTFDKSNAPSVLGSIMRAAKNQTKGKLGIRLSLDTNDGDILDELRIYNGAMTDDEVRTLYFEYDPAAELPYFIPEYYDVEGLLYPEELLLGGATQVTDAESGLKKGTTANGIEYTYTPLTGKATADRDEAGIKLQLSKGDYTSSATVKFRRTLNLQAEKLGYKIGGEAHEIPVPAQNGGEIVVKVAAGTDLSEVEGDIAVKMLEGDDDANNYETAFSYNARTHTALVRCTYKPFRGQDAFYTVRFAEKNTGALESASVTGGLAALHLTEESFTDGAVSVPVRDINSFELSVSLTLAEGATANTALTFTAADLKEGKLSFIITNENGEEKTYSLVPAVLSSDAKLSALSAGSYALSPAFAEDTEAYEVTADMGEGAKVLAAVAATPASDKAVVQKHYDKTSGNIVITVTAEDGTAKQYTIAVHERDTDASLAGIDVGGSPLGDFDPAQEVYTFKYKGTAPSVTARAASQKASVAVGEADAEGKVTVTVTAESGAKKTYSVTLVKMNSDTSLKLYMGETEVTFTDMVAAYNVPLGVQPDLIPVKAEAAEGADVVCRREENKLVFTVTAEDGTAAEYTVNLTSAQAAFGEGAPEDNSPAPNNAGMIGGIVGGVIGGVAVVGAAALLLILKRKKSLGGKRDEKQD